MTEQRNQHTDADVTTPERPEPREEDQTPSDPTTPFEPHEDDESPLGDTDQHSDA